MPDARTTLEPVRVSVLVPIRDEAAALDSVLTAMLAQRVPGGLEFLFVDGRSTDGTRERLATLAGEDSRVRLLDNPARTTASGLNLGLRHARGVIVARMDAHALYPPHYLARGAERLGQGDVDHVSGPAHAEGRGGWSRRIALALSTRLGTGGAVFRRRIHREVEVDTGFTGLWLRTTLHEHGGWNEDAIGDEDFELAARLRAAGGRLVCLPELAARYLVRDTLRALAHQYAAYGYARVRTSLGQPQSMRRSHVLPPALVACLATALAGPRPLRRPARAGAGAYALALTLASAGVMGRARGSDAALLPVVFATMHVAYGCGFLAGCVRLGAPWRALLGLIRPSGR